MTPIVTERLIVRDYARSDLDALMALRNDPEVARYQAWSTPYPEENARSIIDGSLELGDLTAGEWYHLAVEDKATGVYVGDVPLNQHAKFPVTEIGYSFVPAWQGRGLATEAVDAIDEWLFDVHGMRRLEAYLHPDNLPSGRLLERVGFLYEGTKRLSFGTDDDPSDDPVYGMLRSDWVAWRDRPRHEPADVRLVEVDATLLAAVRNITIHRTQERTSPTAAEALLDAYAPGGDGKAWTIVADGVVVGLKTTHALLIDRLHQDRGSLSVR